MLKDNVYEYRLASDMTQIELAEASGLNQPMISDIETGRHPSPNLRTLVALAKALGVGVDKLVKDK